MVAQCDPANGARHQKGGRSPLLGETALSQPKQREPQPPFFQPGVAHSSWIKLERSLFL